MAYGRSQVFGRGSSLNTVVPGVAMRGLTELPRTQPVPFIVVADSTPFSAAS